MRTPQSSSKYAVGLLPGSVWRAGGPNSAAGAQRTEVRVSSLCLTAGDPYEVEGVICASASRARGLAIVQDLYRVAEEQLTPPVAPELLYERRPPRLTQLVPAMEIPALYLTGKEAEERLGIASLSPQDAAEVRRRVVRGFRADEWHAPIVLPGPAPDLLMVVMPRLYLEGGGLRVKRTGPLVGPVPPGLVDFTLGLRPDFPSSKEIGGLRLAPSRRRILTKSWRPRPESLAAHHRELDEDL